MATMAARANVSELDFIGQAQYLWQFRDKRMDRYPLVNRPDVVLGLCALYLVSVFVGPRIMKHREPFQLKEVLIAYNAFKVVYSGCLAYMGLKAGWWMDYNLLCQPMDYSLDAKPMLMTYASWWYFVGKFIEFLDTEFFILRKKNNQITFLHVFHHAVMPVYTWILSAYVPGGNATLAGLCNAIVHFFMYAYYLLSALGPGIQKYLWWKRYITVMQMAQFVLVLTHTVQTVYIQQCDFPLYYSYSVFVLVAIFLVFFANFYIQTYLKRRRLAAEAAEQEKRKQK